MKYLKARQKKKKQRVIPLKKRKNSKIKKKEEYLLMNKFFSQVTSTYSSSIFIILRIEDIFFIPQHLRVEVKVFKGRRIFFEPKIKIESLDGEMPREVFQFT